MIQIWTLLVTDFNTTHGALQGKAKIHCERGPVWSWDREEKDLLHFFFLSVMGSVMAGHRVHKRPVLVESKTQWKLSKRCLKGGLSSVGSKDSYWLWCNVCKYVPRKKIVLLPNKKGVPSIYILGYFLIQPIRLFFIPVAYVKCSLVWKVCQGQVCVTPWELQLWGSTSWYYLLYIILIFSLYFLLSISISVTRINFSL